MQKLMERLDRQDELLLLAMKAEETAHYHGKHPPFSTIRICACCSR